MTRAIRRQLTPDLVRATLAYDPETGVVSRDGRAVGNPNNKGHLKCQLFGNYVYVHRLAWLLTYGEWPSEQIDHIDGDRANNRISNLRDVPHIVNVQNRRKCKGTRKQGSKFSASVFANARCHWLGTFPSFEEAHAAYIQAKRQLHPGFAG